MRLGVVGMMPSDFRAINSEHLAAVRALGLTGVGFHAGGRVLWTLEFGASLQNDSFSFRIMAQRLASRVYCRISVLSVTISPFVQDNFSWAGRCTPGPMPESATCIGADSGISMAR